MKRRDFFKAATLGAVSAIALVGCTSSPSEKLPDPDCRKPKAKSNKPRHRPFSRISYNDTVKTFDELRETYPHLALWSSGVELTDKITTFRSVKNDNILIRMDATKPHGIYVYDMIDINHA